MEEIVTEALQRKVAPALGFLMKRTEEKFTEQAAQIAEHDRQLRSLNLNVAWNEKESYYGQIEVAKRQVAIRGTPKEMADRDQ